MYILYTYGSRWLRKRATPCALVVMVCVWLSWHRRHHNVGGGLNMVTRSPRGRAFQDIVIQSLECKLPETVGFFISFRLVRIGR